MSSQPERWRRSRRFLQFSLLLFLIVASLLAVFPPCVHWYREGAIVDHLPRHTVAYDYDDDATAGHHIPQWRRTLARPWRGHIVEIRFDDLAVVSESNVKALAGLSQLARLRFVTRIRENADFLSHLPVLPRLERLEIDPPRPLSSRGDEPMILPPDKESVEIQDDDLQKITDCCPALRELRLVSREITNAGVEHLARLQRLESVDLPTASVTSEAFAVWKGLPNLRKLALDQALVFEHDLARLRTELPRVDITGSMKTTLEKSYYDPTLTQLLVRGGRVLEYRELEAIARQPSLASLRSVTELRLGGGPPEVAAPWRVDWLDRFPHVRRLTISTAEIPPEQFAALQDLEFLHMVGGFSRNRETAEALARLPRFKELLSVRHPGDDFFAGLSGSPSLEAVHVDGLRLWGGNSAAAFLRALATLKSLRVLCIDEEFGWRLDDEAVSALGRLKNLQLFHTNNASFGTDEQPLTKLDELKNLERLNVLVLDNVDSRPNYLEAISRLPNLRLLVVGGGKSDDVRHLTQLKRLEAFRFSSDYFQTDDLAPLVALPSMRRVFIGQKVTRADYDRLKALNPQCQLSGYVNRELVGGSETNEWWMSFDHLMGYRSFTDGRLETLFGRYLDPPPSRSDFAQRPNSHLVCRHSGALRRAARLAGSLRYCRRASFATSWQ